MSILIKGAKMPSGCRMCEYKEWIAEVRSWICPFRHKFVSNSVLKGGKRYSDCPLVEIPPHGRLIDADALERDNKELWDCDFIHPKYCDTLQSIIGDAPTVIESEEEK